MPLRLRFAAVLAVLAALALAAPAAGGEKKADEEIDYVALAARLIRDGHYDRAARTLEKVDASADGVDLKRLYLLRGLVALQRKVYGEAAGSFERAIARGGAIDPLIYVNLARARFGTRDYRKAVRALDRAGAAAESEPAAALLSSRARWEAGDAGAALAVLRRAGRRFPRRIEFPRLEMLYLVKLGLFREVARRRKRLLARDDLQASDVAAVGEALRRGGQLEEAELMLEAARLRFPGDVDLTVQLARVLMDRGSLLSSAMLLEEAARRDPKYQVEAAELYRRAGRLERALIINQRIADQKVKMRQRLQLLLELERFEMIAAMEPRLSRLGLLGDEQIRYALAYGYFKIGDYESAERNLAGIADPDLFTKSVALRQAIARCRGAELQCP